MSEDEAKELYQDYAEQIKKRGDDAEKYLKELKQTYFHLSQGRKIIDIFEVFKSSSLRENGDPLLGIARADWKKVFLHKERMGAATFSESESQWASDYQNVSCVALPGSTFKDWKMRDVAEDANEWQKRNPEIQRAILQVKVPKVPAHILPNGSLENYYILFEVEEGTWSEKPVPPIAADPYLLKRINANTFVVLAEWDVTPVEQAIMRG